MAGKRVRHNNSTIIEQNGQDPWQDLNQLEVILPEIFILSPFQKYIDKGPWEEGNLGSFLPRR